MKYKQITVSTVSAFTDTLSVLLIDMGSEGVSVVDHADVMQVLKAHTWDYADASLFSGNDDVAYVTGYYDEHFDTKQLRDRLAEWRAREGDAVGALTVTETVLDSGDYENEWKKYYAPIALERVVVVPEWQKYSGDKVPVYIDPGLAFGTGSHETTRLCLEFLERERWENKYVADVGCGSGILGAAVLCLGARGCLLCDIDPQAVQAATDNCARNGVLSRADIRLGSLPSAENAYDAIVANITADVLIALRDDVVRALREGGKLFMSGIIHARAEEVIAAYASRLTQIERKSDGEWEGFAWQKE